jgi:hypothetical protein
MTHRTLCIPLTRDFHPAVDFLDGYFCLCYWLED